MSQFLHNLGLYKDSWTIYLTQQDVLTFIHFFKNKLFGATWRVSEGWAFLILLVQISNLTSTVVAGIHKILYFLMNDGSSIYYHHYEAIPALKWPRDRTSTGCQLAVNLKISWWWRPDCIHASDDQINNETLWWEPPSSWSSDLYSRASLFNITHWPGQPSLADFWASLGDNIKPGGNNWQSSSPVITDVWLILVSFLCTAGQYVTAW